MELYSLPKDEWSGRCSGQLASFIRQLNLYGFFKANISNDSTSPLRGAMVYFHPHFCRSGYSLMTRHGSQQKDLSKKIRAVLKKKKRKKEPTRSTLAVAEPADADTSLQKMKLEWWDEDEEEVIYDDHLLRYTSFV